MDHGWRYKACAKDSMRYKMLGTPLWALVVYIVLPDACYGPYICVLLLAQVNTNIEQARSPRLGGIRWF
jgi:hypothetical protein